jgi:hypothetical protein
MHIDGIGKFNMKPVSVEYCIELNDSTFLKILNVDWCKNVPLSSKLDVIDGIQDVDYDAFLGPNIFITVDNNVSKNKIRKAVSEKILEHLELLKGE